MTPYLFRNTVHLKNTRLFSYCICKNVYNRNFEHFRTFSHLFIGKTAIFANMSTPARKKKLFRATKNKNDVYTCIYSTAMNL